MSCTYDFKGPDGKLVRITGKADFKAYLASGGLQFLLPARAAAFLREGVTSTPEFKDWFGKSVVVDGKGKPKVMYHGTAQDISTFKGKQAGAIFVTDDPKFAEDFAVRSEFWMLKNAAKEGEPQSSQNIMPVFVKAENPFDYANAGHIDGLKKYEEANRYSDKAIPIGHIEQVQRGAWEFIEDPRVQAAIKSLGHDGFYAKEDGRKNLAVYSPAQIKSATGNNGAFDANNPDIRFRKTAIQEAISPRSRQQTEMVERLANGMAAKLANPPEIVVFSSLQDGIIPQSVRDEDARQREGGATGTPEGFYFKGKAYIWDGLKRPEDVARVFAHEVLGHYGLRGVFGQALTPVLEQIVALRKADVLAKAKEYGLDTKDPAAMLKAAEEVLAEMAQTKPDIGFVTRAVAAIRAWLRQNVPGFASMEFSDAEIIQNFLLPARAFVERGAQAGRDKAAASFSRSPSATIEIDGKQRSTTNSNGQPIAATEEGVKNFWKWFGDSVVHAPMVSSKQKRTEMPPLVVYHGTRTTFDSFAPVREGNVTTMFGDEEKVVRHGIFFAESPEFADTFAKQAGPGNANVVPVYLKIENPLYLDEGFTDEVIAELRGAGLPEDQAARLRHRKADMAWAEFDDEAGEAMVAAIRAAGYDGVLTVEPGVGVEGEEQQTVWVALDPTQIKSAIGNSGEFDPANPDIRFSRAAPVAPTGLTPPEQGLLRRIQAAVQDNKNRVRQVQERIQEVTGKPVSERSNYYGAESQRPGRIAARLEDAKEKLTGPLMEKLAKSGHTAEQLGELLHAMHAQERNEAVARINPDMPDGGSGMTTDQANAILAKNRTNRVLHELANDARAIAKETLNLKHAYGLIDNETFDTLNDAYKNYVPLKGDGEFGPKVKRAMGHDEREEHILENIARDYDQAVVVGEKNLARQSLLQMVLENPDKDLWTVGVPPKGRYVVGQTYDIYKGSEKVASFDRATQAQAWVQGRTDDPHTYIIQTDRRKFVVEKDGKPFRTFDSYSDAENYIGDIKEPVGKFEVKQSGETVREFVKPLQDNEIMVYVDGRPVRIQIIGDEQLARQLRPLDQGKMNAILEMMRSVNRYLSKIYTGYNPAFIIRNTARDAMTGTINMIGNEGAGTAAKAWANYPAALKALSIYAATGKEPSGEAGAYLNEYRQHGGKTGASWMSDLEEQGKSLKRMFDDAYGASGYLKDGKAGKAAAVAGRKIVGGMAHVVEVANQATENGLRLSLYMAMRKQGSSPGVAAQAAKSVTVDFDRKGSMTGALGAIFLFFNPAVQGTSNAIKTLAKGAHKEQAWMALGALAALGAYAASQGMDDDEDRWLGEGWESRSSNFMMNIGGHTIKVPLSMEFKPFYAAGIAMTEAKRGESKLKAAGHLISSFIDAYFPLQGAFNSESDNHGADLTSAVTPTVLKPWTQLAQNRSSFGSQITPENDFTKDRPDNLKMFKGTKGSVYDAAAQGLAKVGEMAGAGRYENDMTKVSPETLKMLWRTYTGGLGQFVTDMGGLANIGTQAPDSVETADVPIVKDFVKPNDVRAIRGRYYELTHQAKEAATEFQQAKKAGDGEAIDAILDRPEKAELLGLDRLIKRTNEAASMLRDQAVDINADTSLSMSDKRAKLKELEKDEEALYRDAIRAFK